MLPDMTGHSQLSYFVVNNLSRELAQHQVDLVVSRVKLVQEPLEIDGPAGPGAGDHKFHR
jgi:hypothetical protein